MIKRRTFLHGGLLTLTAGDWMPLVLGGDSDSRRKTKPIVIATWKNIEAVQAAWRVLQDGGSALDAVEAGARVPEADPEDTSVGYGGFPDRDGEVTLDACIMDHEGNAGSVVYLSGIMHAVSVARRVMEQTPHVMLAGDGAHRFAIEQGFPKTNLLTEKARLAWEQWKIKSEYKPVINIERHDTIGILALDQQDKLSGACTTSGLAFKMKGRVGDSPIIGSGLFVDQSVGAATATGLGEAVMKKAGAFSIVELMRQGKHPQKACQEAIGRLLEIRSREAFQVGYIALNAKGEIGAYSLRPGFQASVIGPSGFLLINAPYRLENEKE